MGVWRLFRESASLAARQWQVLAVWWLGELVPAGLLALLPALDLFGPSHLTAFSTAAQGLPAWMIIELLAPFDSSVSASGLNLASSYQGTVLFTFLIWLVLTPFFAWLLSSLLDGGGLQQYLERQHSFRLGRFIASCWRSWGAFLVLGVGEALSGLLIGLPGVILTGMAFTLAGWLGWLFLLLLLFAAGIWLAFFELSRAELVAGGNRNFLSALGSAASVLWKKPAILFEFYALALFALLLIHAFFRLGLFPRLPLAAWLLALMVQQAFILLRLWCRAVRYAGVVSFVQ